MILSIFSCASWPSVCLLWRDVYLGLPPIFWLGCFVLLFCIKVLSENFRFTPLHMSNRLTVNRLKRILIRTSWPTQSGILLIVPLLRVPQSMDRVERDQRKKKGYAIFPGSSNRRRHSNTRSEGENSYKHPEKLDKRKLMDLLDLNTWKRLLKTAMFQ